MQAKVINFLSKNKLVLQAIKENFIFDVFEFWFYLDICKTKIFLSSSPHCDGNFYADKLKNPHMWKNQQKLKNQHAGNRPLDKKPLTFITKSSTLDVAAVLDPPLRTLNIRTIMRFDYCTAEKMKFFIKDFFSKCDQIRSFLWIWSHLLNNSLIENFIFCAVLYLVNQQFCYSIAMKLADQLTKG